MDHEEESGKGRQSRERRSLAARGTGRTGISTAVAVVRSSSGGSGDGGVGGQGAAVGAGERAESPTRGGVRRSSSLGRLSNMRLPSLSLVEIDIENTTSNNVGNNNNRNNNSSRSNVEQGKGINKCFSFTTSGGVVVEKGVEDSGFLTHYSVGGGGDNGDDQINGAATSSAAALTLCATSSSLQSCDDVDDFGLRRRTFSSFRRRPSLPLLKIVSDFGGGGGGGGGGGDGDGGGGGGGDREDCERRTTSSSPTPTTTTTTGERFRSRSLSLSSPLNNISNRSTSGDVKLSLFDAFNFQAGCDSPTPSSTRDVRSSKHPSSGNDGVTSRDVSFDPTMSSHDVTTKGGNFSPIQTFRSGLDSSPLFSSVATTSGATNQSESQVKIIEAKVNQTNTNNNIINDKNNKNSNYTTGNEESQISTNANINHGVHNNNNNNNYNNNNYNNHQSVMRSNTDPRHGPICRSPTLQQRQQVVKTKQNGDRPPDTASEGKLPMTTPEPEPHLPSPNLKPNAGKTTSSASLDKSFEGWSSKQKNDSVQQTCPSATPDFTKRRSSSLKRDFKTNSSTMSSQRDFGRTSPMLSHKNLGRTSPLFSHVGDFGRTPSPLLSQKDIIGRTNSPLMSPKNLGRTPSPMLSQKDFGRSSPLVSQKDTGRTTPSPLMSPKDRGRKSPMLNYNDVFGNSSSNTFEIGRTSSPVRFLPNSETPGNTRRTTLGMLTSSSSSVSGTPGNTRRASPLLRSLSSTDFKSSSSSTPQEVSTWGSRRNSQCSQSSEDARDILQAALEQMDDIIASTNNSLDLSVDEDQSSSSTSSSSHNRGLDGIVGGGVSPLLRNRNNNFNKTSDDSDLASRVAGLTVELRHFLETTDNPDELKTSVPRDTLLVIRDWLIPDVDEIFSLVNVRSHHSEETVRRLEEDRHSLTLQVSVLTDQIEAQAEKIREMDLLMEEDKRRIMDANEILQQELLSRSHLESHQLELMSEVSGLKLRLASAEKDRRELDDRCRAAQRQAAELEAKLVMKDAENSELRMRLSRNGTMPLDADKTEIEKLKRAVDTLMLANEEKERKLEDLRRLLRRYRRVEEILVQAQGRKAVEELLTNIEDGDTSSNSSSTTPSVGDNVRSDSTTHATGSNHLSVEDRMDGGRAFISSPSATSTPVHGGSSETSRLNASFHGTTNSNGSAPPVLAMGGNSRQAMGLTRSNSCENLVPGKAPPGKGDHHNTMGGRAGGGGGSLISPGYANSEVVTDDEDGLQHYGPGGQGDSKKRRGLRRLFGRLKRSSSQDLEGSRDRRENNNPPGDFRRGGVRATATARLAWNRDVKGRISTPDIPFARWDTDRITAWLNDIGLNMYLVDCKRWVRNGEQLLRCSQQDLEKELGMKNSLHRKKLTLAMQSVSHARPDLMEELDHNFVARWLDDIGLPQYKDSFYDGRVDARMLNSLTVEDLFHLKVSNEVHHVSIRRGIQALRLNNFNPNALRRRPVPEEQQKHMESIPGDVLLWTNHRVMEWLRTIDLSEYAPNLRGSGVHGALMVLEPRFNAELFAILLSIPSSKTLLRRHLSSHFIGLIGSETQQRKRECESESGFVPLTHNNKIKKGKFGLFNHKRSRSEPEMDSLICPPDLNGHQHNNGKVDGKKGKSKKERQDSKRKSDKRDRSFFSRN